jgi:hypothetical protein
MFADDDDITCAAGAVVSDAGRSVLAVGSLTLTQVNHASLVALALPGANRHRTCAQLRFMALMEKRKRRRIQVGN